MSFAPLQQSLADRYRIERELGQGGMATVYLAHDLRHGRDIALKVLHPDLGAALGGERFLAEIRTTAKLQHPHILPLLDSGDAGEGLLWYAMPFVRGETLRARLERERQLPIEDALRIAREVADALQHAHAQGIVHRDIKPENILLQEGHALVADFGIALAVQQAGGQRMTQTGLSLGTPQYMSPEQAMGEKAIDARSDVYALGAVTYEMLAGDPPFTGSSIQAIVARVLTERPTPLRTLRDTVPPPVDDAVAQALAKLPADRPASAAAFAARLQATGATRSATAPTVLSARRRLLPVALAALAVGAALGAGGMLLARRSAGEALQSPYATGNAQLTFDGRAGLVAISPGGEAIAFARSRCEQPGASGFLVPSDQEAQGAPCRYALVMMDSAGTREVTVVEGMHDVRSVRFTSDGTRLVIAATLEPGRSGVYVVPRLGGALRRVGPFGAFDLQRGTDSLLIIPAGASRSKNPMASVVDLESGRATDSIAMPSRDVFFAAWSPDHRRLVAVTSSMLYVMDRGGALTDSASGAWKAHLRWTPRGDAVIGFVPAPGRDDAFIRLRIDGDGRVQGPAVAMMPRVQTLYRGEFDIAWKTGALAYVGGDVTNEVWTFALDGRSAPRLVGSSTTFYDVPAIAPDGRALYVVRGDALGDNVYRVPIDSGRPVEEPLTSSRGSGVFGTVRVTADGSR
ncbi:MAG TPA: serine/threonine-protein kinase, partial [Gemmatimonadaceae bacterium]|nr:serine/threonine-protein kinase [Gemmatimonadaceae bacterium]